MYGEADGLQCHVRADGEELVESAVYDDAEDGGFLPTGEAAVAAVAADLFALRLPGLSQQGDGTTVRLVDDHGHVRAVMRLRRGDGGFRVDEVTACSPG